VATLSPKNDILRYLKSHKSNLDNLPLNFTLDGNLKEGYFLNMIFGRGISVKLAIEI